MMPIWKYLLLASYYHASRPYRWLRNRRSAADGHAPVFVLFYHRVADDESTPWTIGTRTFQRHIHWLQSNFDLVSLEEAQRRIRGKNDRAAVSITFDDGYGENFRTAVPLLIKERIPCTYFVSTRHVLGGVPFPHDVVLGYRFPPNTREQLREMAAAGFEIGAHTRTHADLGKITQPQRLYDEVVAAGEELQVAIGAPVRYFAFPYGQHANLNADVFHLAYDAGYEAVCSAYGGYNSPGEDAFHLQRIHGDLFLRLQNHLTVDPLKPRVKRFEYEPIKAARAAAGVAAS
jgi:peptidoglycan/xylan/chitin deacetylase (PgdA/CDA1 family)